jgi:hypothetical protein
MTTRTLITLSAAIEFATGAALIVVPAFIGRAVLGVDLSGTGVAVARVAGLGLLSLGLACWPSRNDANPHATRALFIYNLLAAFYLGYLRAGAGFVSYLLWPACALHAMLTILLIIQHKREARPEYLDSTFRRS